MPAEPLSSNAVNYLVWRYLQEAGYGNAALQLSRCWNRNPDSLPFAKNVKEHELVNLLQDGLWFDKTQAEVTGTSPRYNFGDDPGPPYSIRDGNLLTLNQGIPAHQLVEKTNEGIPDPPPKKGKGRKKATKVNGVAPPPEPQLNGEPMDVDQNNHTHATNSVRAESEAVGSEVDSPTVVDLPISTLSIGVDTEIQTDPPARLAARSNFTAIREDGKEVNHTTWGTPDMPLLLATGKSILRLLHYPKSGPFPSGPPDHYDFDVPLRGQFSITASCWISPNELAVSAREELTNEVGEVMQKNQVLKLATSSDNTECQIISSTAGLVTALRYNTRSNLLLGISTDGEKGSVKIWQDSEEEATRQLSAWDSFTDKVIYDAVWLGEKSFAIAGDGVLNIYDIHDTLGCRQKLQTSVRWEVLRYDGQSGIMAAMGMEGGKSFMGVLNMADSTNLRVQEYPDEYFTDLNFRPGSWLPSHTLLATCATSGEVRIWNASQPFECVQRLTLADHGMANAISFSPDGRLLAAAGPGVVTVWNMEKTDEPVGIWRADEVKKGDWDPSVDGELMLGWDPDTAGGLRLSISLGNQIAVIPV
ncbi:hypothetical protein M011DRAFT_475926 [Sporormia fimetaria CBS 119925]|uniref:Uncharacterized protein n=1 Tax=Sporormia fimetaria CBS 119925 TaxID=1340428 RepID=A0A6A6VF25_9PLEO|nr:hypothetical protein M011DRAFT_475926 [Sporormia fimetaria CBS 119925]